MPIRVQNHGFLFSCVTPKFAAQNPLARSTVMWMAKSMNATNQNRGAMKRISVIATAKCTRQCANSGSPQPVFWSLPIAIQELCKTKSAMMCLKVRSNIHPASAATGTDEIGRNNKLTPRCRWLGQEGDGGVQRNFF